MRTTSHMRYALAFAFVMAGTGLANAQAQRVSPEEAEEQGLSASTPAVQAEGTTNVCTEDVLLVPDSSDDSINLFDPTTGDIVQLGWVVDPDNLSTPKSAIPNFDNTGIFVSDQIDDHIVEYDCTGGFVGILADNADGLDNIRGITLSPDGTEVWVSVGSGTFADGILSCDMTGTCTTLVTPGAGGLDSPFDVLVRDSDVLVPGFGSDDIHRYDFDGTFLDLFSESDGETGIDAPEQIALAANGNVLAAGFSSPSGVYEYDGTTGDEVGYYDAVTGLRGVYELPNGNILATNSAGLFEITRSNTIVDTVSVIGDQNIERFPPVGGGACDIKFIDSDLTYDAETRRLCATVTVQNNGVDPVQARLELDFNFMGGNPMGTRRLGGGVLPGGAQATRTICLRVPNNAPDGDYNLTLRLVDVDGETDCGTYDETLSISAPRIGDSVSGGELFEVIAPADLSASATTSDAPVAVAPNPFARQTTLSYDVAAAADVRLAVYDVLGREVAVLVDARQDAGTHQAVFDASDLAAGTYVYRLVVGSEVRTGRMTLAH